MSVANEQDLQDLITNKVREGKSIDYKEILPGNIDSEKKEFLADVSSFANAAGGNLIFGIVEKAGLPIKICGLKGINVDTEIQRLESILRDGLEPRIPGLSIYPIKLQRSGVVIVIRIPRSWASPHRISFQEWSRFYSRNSAGKYPLDVEELRAAFVFSDSSSQRIRNFRVERLSRIIANDGPVSVVDGGKLVIHIVPLNTSDPTIQIDLSMLGSDPEVLQSSWGWHRRHNFDGYLIYGNDTGSSSYLQIFRNGSIEAVDARITSSSSDGVKLVMANRLGTNLGTRIQKLLMLQKRSEIQPPLLIAVSLLGVLGQFMNFIEWELYREKVHRIDKNDLLIPEFLVEDFNHDIAESIRQVTYTVWNAAGWPEPMIQDQRRD